MSGRGRQELQGPPARSRSRSRSRRRSPGEALPSASQQFRRSRFTPELQPARLPRPDVRFFHRGVEYWTRHDLPSMSSVQLLPIVVLKSACKRGDIAAVRAILAQRPCQVDLNEPILFSWICATSPPGVVPLFLQDGRVNVRGSPLSQACMNDHRASVELLLRSQRIELEHEEFSPLHCACQSGHQKLVKLLLKHRKKFQLLQQDRKCFPHGQELIYSAAKAGHLHVVQCLLKNRAIIPPDNERLSPFVAACEAGRVKVVDFMLRSDSLPELLESKPPRRTHQSNASDALYYPLYAACSTGALGIATTLLSNPRIDTAREITRHFDALMKFAILMGDLNFVRRLSRENEASDWLDQAIETAQSRGIRPIHEVLVDEKKAQILESKEPVEDMTDIANAQEQKSTS